jgi:hypothetical protein
MFIMMVVRKIKRDNLERYFPNTLWQRMTWNVGQRWIDGCEADIIDFDILTWWKVNAPKFHTLAEITLFVLAIYISNVASESAFINGRHVLDLFKSSLSPLTYTVDALICTQDWLKNRSINNDEELEDFMESYDEHDKCL